MAISFRIDPNNMVLRPWEAEDNLIPTVLYSDGCEPITVLRVRQSLIFPPHREVAKFIALRLKTISTPNIDMPMTLNVYVTYIGADMPLVALRASPDLSDFFKMIFAPRAEAASTAKLNSYAEQVIQYLGR